MIATWMLGATVFTLLIGIAAMAAERALRTTQLQTRMPWAVALTIALVWPVAAPSVHRTLRESTPMELGVVDVPVTSASLMISQQLPAMPPTWNERFATALVVLWAMASTILLARLLFAARALSRVQAKAQPAVLDGQDVLVTESVGPAVIGLIRPRVAVPQWFMQLDAPLRALVLRHESEHCRSHDPQLVWLAAIAVAAMPWNPGLWWLSRRLRLALEIDCDTRTLRRESSHEQYGKLLLLIAQRQSGYPLATMLAESTSHLSRRITAMQMKPLHRPLIRTLISGTIAVGALAVACSPRVATDLTGPKPTAARSTSKSTSPGATYFEFQVEKPVTVAAGSVAPVYPTEAKAAHVSGKVLVQFVVNEQGIPEANTLKILDSEHTDPVFATAVRQALPNMRFEAAQVGGKAVKQLVQQPFEFGVAKNTVTAGSLPSTQDAAQRAMIAQRKDMPGTVGAQSGATIATPSTSSGTSVRVKPASVAELASGTAPVTAPKSATQPYFEFQVERAVAFAPGTVGPAYPAALKAAKIEGQLLVQFVVDEDGIADVRSFKLLRLRAENNEVVHQEFVDAVLDALPNMRFIPAQVGGRNVKQLVQLPFQFSLSN